MAGGGMHTPHLNPLDPSLAISYRNHQKSLAYFSHLAPLTLFFFTKKRSQKGGTWPNAPLNTLLGDIFRTKFKSFFCLVATQLVGHSSINN